ncbi:MAG: hypothetical protein ACM3UT_08380 [Chloroflexota bacterium]
MNKYYSDIPLIKQYELRPSTDHSGSASVGSFESASVGGALMDYYKT